MEYDGVRKHARMSMDARAAQFAPFAALTGYNDAIDETARTTSAQVNLSSDEQHTLSKKLAYVLSFVQRPLISITFFRPDNMKSGGAYVTVHGTVKKVEECINILTFIPATSNGLTIAESTAGILPSRKEIEISLDAIADISGDIFDDME